MEDGYHYGDRYLMEDGAWKPSSYLVCLACRFFCFTLVVGGFCVIVSRTVVSAPYYDMPCLNRFVVLQAKAPPQRERREGGAFVINP